MKFNNPAERIMVALDFDELADAQAIIEDLKGIPVTFKIGNQLGTYEGWKTVIDFANQHDAKIFCDTKFKDIPATVEKSSRAITRHQPHFFNIMADNSLAALEGAVAGANSAVKDFNVPKPILLGVTVLTSINNDESQSIYGGSPANKVIQFATMAAKAGLDGIVCSPKEAKLLKENVETKDLLLVTPGIRPEWAVAGDQSRIMTPKQAIADGSDYLVIGRPITQPPPEVGSPRDAVLKILQEIGD